MINRLEKFLQSPYHITNEHVVNYGCYLITESKKNGGHINQSDEEMWREIMGNVPYDDLKFRKLNSDLLKAIQTFLGLENLKSKPETELLLQLETIIGNKIEPLYNSIKSQIQRSSKTRLDRSAEYFYDRFIEEKLMFEMTSDLTRLNRKTALVRNFNIEAINQNLDISYLIEKYKLISTLLSWKKIANIDLDLESFEDEIILKNQSIIDSYPSIKIYKKISEILKNPNETNTFYQLRRLVKENISKFPLNDVKYIYDALLTFAIDRMNKGDKDFLLEVFNLYQEAIEVDGFLQDGILKPISFRNITIIGLRLKKFDWVEKFILNYSEKVDIKHRENARRFNLATLYFYQKRYEDVISELQRVNYEDLWYNLNSKTLLLATYFELDEIEVMESMIGSFKVFISREKTLSSTRKKHYLNFINFLKKLSKIKDGDYEKLDVLSRKITDTAGVVSKSWLLEKLNEMKN